MKIFFDYCLVDVAVFVTKLLLELDLLRWNTSPVNSQTVLAMSRYKLLLLEWTSNSLRPFYCSCCFVCISVAIDLFV